MALRVAVHQVIQVGGICYFFDLMLDPIETAELVAFTKTIEAKSLSRAALELGAPRATVGRRLARLEERLGVRLLRRTTRTLVLTDAGDALYLHARIVLDALRQAEASVQKTDSAIKGSLRVAVPAKMHPSFYLAVCEFARTYPEVQIQVHAGSRYVDLRREGYDAALRAGTELEPGLVARTLSRAYVQAVASPAYVAAHGAPRTERDLRAHECLLGFTRGEVPQTHWPKAGGGKIPVQGSFVTNDVGLLIDAAVAGLGIALLPMSLIESHIENGALVPVLPKVIQAESRVSVVYPEKEFLPPQVRAFVDAIVAWAAIGLKPASSNGLKPAPAVTKRAASKRSRNRTAR